MRTGLYVASKPRGHRARESESRKSVGAHTKFTQARTVNTQMELAQSSRITVVYRRKDGTIAHARCKTPVQSLGSEEYFCTYCKERLYLPEMVILRIPLKE